ncbi:tyrosine-type recombinase/integrase [Nonomuraea sp. B12E4]|uniref:tyrosine-type recombinase/integrase n=1 Tax=Nonomuraea sp. B12E4 TaxID=3153564 RepID=UPI00325CE295
MRHTGPSASSRTARVCRKISTSASVGKVEIIDVPCGATLDSKCPPCAKRNTPIEPRNPNRAFDAHCKIARVPRIRVHDTRHTCASLLAALDVHPRVAMRILRHSQISVTMNV